MIRSLDRETDRAAVSALLHEAQDAYLIWKGHAPGPAETDSFFNDVPPGCDLSRSRHLGLFIQGTLSGVAELSFGFPAASDAYLGLILLAPRSRGQGHGARFVTHLEDVARKARAKSLYLGVLEQNPRAVAFWGRMGFVPTWISRQEGHHTIHRLGKTL